MKKYLSVLLCAIIVFSLASCRSEKDISSKTNSFVSELTTTQTSELTVSSETETVSEPQSSTETVTSSVESTPSSKVTISSAISSSNTTQNKPNNNNVNNNSVVTTFDIFKPKVIASLCEHTYIKPSCTAPLLCTKCGETGPSIYQGEKVTYSHAFKDNKCQDCGYVTTMTSDNYVELSGHFCETNKEITLDIWLRTDEETVIAYPCISFYKYVNNEWVPYEGLYWVGEFFGLVATPGEILVSDTGVKYGRWDYMSNEILQQDPSATVESDFSEYRLIRRFKVSIPEPGIYKYTITEGPNDEKKTDNPNGDYMTQATVY